jgi:hypothetical protein
MQRIEHTSVAARMPRLSVGLDAGRLVQEGKREVVEAEKM